MRRILVIVLCLALLCGITPSLGFAAEKAYSAVVTDTGISAELVYMTNSEDYAYYKVEKTGVLSGDPGKKCVTETVLIDRTGKAVLRRQVAAAELNYFYEYRYLDNLEPGYAVSDKYIFDRTPVVRDSSGNSGYLDYAIYDRDTLSVKAYVSEIVSKYWGKAPERMAIHARAYNGSAEYVQFSIMSFDDDEREFILDLNSLSILFDYSTGPQDSFYQIVPYSEGVIPYEFSNWSDEGMWVPYEIGFFDVNKNKVLSLDALKLGYRSIQLVSQGMIVVRNSEEAQGVIDRSGKVVIPFQYSRIGAFYGNYAAASSNGKAGVIDKSNKKVIPFEYEDSYSSDGKAFPVEKNGKWGLVDISNKTILPFEYDDFTNILNGRAFAVKNGTIHTIQIKESVTSIFKDVPAGAWYADFLQTAYDAGIVGGTSSDAYSPGSNLTHGQIIVMVANLHSLEKGDRYDFAANKVAGTHWCSAFLNYCKAEGIIDSRFDDVLDEQVDRGEMAYYFANALPAKYYTSAKSADLTDIADNSYAASIAQLAAAGIVGGYSDKTYKPENLVTRAEASVFVSNIINLIP